MENREREQFWEWVVRGGPLKTNQKLEARGQRPEGSLEARRQRPEGATGHALRLKARWRIYIYIYIYIYNPRVALYIYI